MSSEENFQPDDEPLIRSIPRLPTRNEWRRDPDRNRLFRSVELRRVDQYLREYENLAARHEQHVEAHTDLLMENQTLPRTPDIALALHTQRTAVVANLAEATQVLGNLAEAFARWDQKKGPANHSPAVDALRASLAAAATDIAKLYDELAPRRQREIRAPTPESEARAASVVTRASVGSSFSDVVFATPASNAPPPAPVPDRSSIMSLGRVLAPEEGRNAPLSFEPLMPPPSPSPPSSPSPSPDGPETAADLQRTGRLGAAVAQQRARLNREGLPQAQPQRREAPRSLPPIPVSRSTPSLEYADLPQQRAPSPQPEAGPSRTVTDQPARPLTPHSRDGRGERRQQVHGGSREDSRSRSRSPSPRRR